MSESGKWFVQELPILQQSGVQILWDGPVKKLNSHKKLQARYLVISSIGLFLFKSKTFQRNYQLTRSLSFAHLSGLSLDTDYFTVEEHGQHIVIQHPEINKMCTIVYTIHETLFPEKKINFNLSDDLRSQVEATIFIYEPINISAEKFLSYAVGYSEKATIDNIRDMVNLFKNPKPTFTITEDILDSPLYYAVAKTVAASKFYTAVVLNDVNLTKACKVFIPICKENDSIKTLTMKNVEFSNPDGSLYDAFAKGSIFSATQFCFVNCNMKSLDIMSLIDFFQIYTHEVNKLVFDNCKFTSETIVNMLQSIFVAPCFGRLRSLSIISPDCEWLDAALMLVSSSWMIEERCLRELSLIDCGLDLSSILPYIMEYENGLVRLNLSGNHFSSPFTSKGQKSFHDIDELIMQNTTFTETTFVDVLRVISSSDPSPSILDLSNAKMASTNLAYVYAELPSIAMPEVRGISWKGIDITSKRRLDSFIEFINLMPNIKELDITGCFKQPSAFVNDIISLINRKQIEKISFGNCKEDGNLKEFIDSLRVCPTIKSIIITNANLGKEEIKLLKCIIPQLEEFRINECSATSTADLEDLCKAVLASGIKKTSFPEAQVQSALSSIPQMQRTEKIRAIEELRNQYSNKYSSEEEEEDLSDRQHKILRSYVKRGQALLDEISVDPELQTMLKTCLNGSVRNVLLDEYLSTVSKIPLDLCI